MEKMSLTERFGAPAHMPESVKTFTGHSAVCAYRSKGQVTLYFSTVHTLDESVRLKKLFFQHGLHVLASHLGNAQPCTLTISEDQYQKQFPLDQIPTRQQQQQQSTTQRLQQGHSGVSGRGGLRPRPSQR